MGLFELISRLAVRDGTSGDDTIRGSRNDDIIKGFGGDDALLGEDGNDTLRGGNGDDTLDGHDGNDRLLGGEGNDHLFGGKGRDVLIGGAGRDLLELGPTGGSRDKIVLRDISDSEVGSRHDLVTDFIRGQDTVKLSDIDADISSAQDDAFCWIGSEQFSGTPGDLRVANDLLQGDVDGDGVADFEIFFSGFSAPTEADIIL